MVLAYCKPEVLVSTINVGVFVALLAGFLPLDALLEMTNIGTLFAFAIVSIGVVVLRVVEPERHRPFRVPLVWVVGPLGALACAFIMAGLPVQAWERFGLWLGLGLIVYLGYGARHSRLRQSPPA